jgi:N-formylglutamate amidohydrolase
MVVKNGRGERKKLQISSPHSGLRIPVNVNSYSGDRERRFFSTHHPDRFLPQLFTFSQLTPLFYA